MVTQRDVANLAGVSFITVSRVINGEGNVKEETRLKVEKAIEKLGYVPGFAGRVLHTGRCNTIALLTPIPFYDRMRSFYLNLVLSGVTEFCRPRNLDLMMDFVPEVGLENSFDYLRPYKQRKVDGIIYVGLKKIPDDMLIELKARQLPCVVLGDRPDSPLVSWIDTDNFSSGVETVKKFYEKGHRKIAFLGLKKNIFNANVSDREAGFESAVRELGLDYDGMDYVIRTEFDSEKIRADLKRQFPKLKARPTGIFCAADSMIPAAVSALEELGLSVPKDVSLVGFDGYLKDTFYPLEVATNEQPLRQMGKEAAEILFARIEDKSLPIEKRVLPVRFVDGKSLAKI